MLRSILINNKKKIMRRVIRLTENDLLRLVRRVIKESEDDQQMELKKANVELINVGIPPIGEELLDSIERREDASDTVEQMSEDIDPNLEPMEQKEFLSVQNQLFQAICKSTPDQLETAKKQLLGLLRTRKRRDRSLRTEGVPAAAIPFLGVTVSPAVLIVLGVLILVLIFSRLFRKRDGMGCEGRETWNGMIKRINGSQRMRRGL
jgi:hypothetical protein